MEEKMKKNGELKIEFEINARMKKISKSTSGRYTGMSIKRRREYDHEHI